MRPLLTGESARRRFGPTHSAVPSEAAAERLSAGRAVGRRSSRSAQRSAESGEHGAAAIRSGCGVTEAAEALVRVVGLSSGGGLRCFAGRQRLHE